MGSAVCPSKSRCTTRANSAAAALKGCSWRIADDPPGASGTHPRIGRFRQLANCGAGWRRLSRQSAAWYKSLNSDRPRRGEEVAMFSRWFATIVVTAALVPGVGRGEVAGKWVAELTSPMLLEPAYIRVVLARTGDAVSGAWGTEIVKGMVKGSTVSLALTDTAGRDAGTLTGKIEGDAGGGG